MIKYAKLKEDGAIEYAPKNKDGISNWISNAAAVTSAGYLPIEEDVEVPANSYINGYAVNGDKIIPMISELPAPTYIELRKQAYPAIEEQLDMLYWDKIKGTDIWRDTITDIKNTYPKPVVESLNDLFAEPLDEIKNETTEDDLQREEDSVWSYDTW